jgi:hypothetical protein
MLPNAAVWRSAIEDLSPHASPCRYLTPARWVPLREAAIDFCERLGAEAHAFGWTAAELFAVHPEHGTRRVEFCGVLIVSGSKRTWRWSRPGSCLIGARATGPNRVGSGAFRYGSLPRTVWAGERSSLRPDRQYGSLLAFTLIVTILAACGITGVVP